MTRFLILFLTALCVANGLRVMSFNIWRSGSKVHDGLTKVAESIEEANPDIVALQEARDHSDTISTIVAKLNKRGGNWIATERCGGIGNAVITRHKIVGYDHVRYGMNVRVQLRNTGQEISIWSMHLNYVKYGPDAMLKGRTNKQILDDEINGENSRVDNIVDLLRTPAFVQQIKNSNNVPVIVAGDFNVPSDLDYTEAEKGSHNGYVIEWPATKLLREAAGMTDSYREVHPNPGTYPGNTWPVYDIDKDAPNDPVRKDRIDFIFYRGSIRPYASEVFSGKTKMRMGYDWEDNTYPSDHGSVITDFEFNDYDDMIRQAKYKKEPTFAHQYPTYGSPAVATCPLKIVQ